MKSKLLMQSSNFILRDKAKWEDKVNEKEMLPGWFKNFGNFEIVKGPYVSFTLERVSLWKFQ